MGTIPENDVARLDSSHRLATRMVRWQKGMWRSRRLVDLSLHSVLECGFSGDTIDMFKILKALMKLDLCSSSEATGYRSRSNSGAGPPWV